MKKKEILTLRISENIKTMLIKLAEKENRSMTNMVETLIIRAHSEQIKGKDGE